MIIGKLSKTYTSNTKNKEIEIKTKIEYEKLIPALPLPEYSILKKSIKEQNGNIVPIVINQEGVIIDGHQRYRACKELGIISKIEVMEFTDHLIEKEFIITINRNRRQLNAFQISELGYKLEEIEKKRAKFRLSNAGKIGSDIRWKPMTVDDSSCNGVGSNGTTLLSTKEKEEEKGKTSDIIAKKIGLSPTTYFKARKIIVESSEEQKQRLREGKDKIDKIYKFLQKEKRKVEFLKLNKQSPNQLQELLPQNNNNNNNNNDDDGTNESVSFKLLYGNLSEKGKEILSNSIDLIFTDPPYASDSITIYSDLAILASRVLKSGGSLVTYFGQHILPKVIEVFVSNNLKYWWVIGVKHTGSTKAFHQRKVFVMWKPLLWFIKGDEISSSYPIAGLNDYLYDHVESKPPEKILHPWEQSTVEAEHVIKKLTFENQIVLDPLMGSGTTGLSAVNLKRQFIGIEKEKEKFNIAKNRLEAKEKQNQSVNPDLILIDSKK